MTETSMIIAQLVVVALLFVFVWAVVRSAGKTLSNATPPALALEDPVVRHDTAAHPLVRRPEESVEAELPAVLPPAPTPPDPHPQAEIARVAPRKPDLFADEGEKHAADPDKDAEEAPRESLPPTERAHSQSTAEVLASGIQPRLVIETSAEREGEEIPLGGGLTIGRSASNDLHLDDSYMSHMHARILRRGSFFFVQDLGSTNGTFLNGQRVDHAQLRVRDTLKMGETTLRYEE